MLRYFWFEDIILTKLDQLAGILVVVIQLTLSPTLSLKLVSQVLETTFKVHFRQEYTTPIVSSRDAHNVEVTFENSPFSSLVFQKIGFVS